MADAFDICTPTCTPHRDTGPFFFQRAPTWHASQTFMTHVSWFRSLHKRGPRHNIEVPGLSRATGVLWRVARRIT
eukprot:6174851-Pyramimonas_sp.AAC.1